MNVYPYKTVRAGEFTKYQVNIMENGSIVVEHFFKNKMKSQTVFELQNDIKSSSLPKHIKELAGWAIYESKALIVNVESSESKWF